MSKRTEQKTNPYTRILYVGGSGSGKTGSLASLVPDYDLRILDMDNGLDILDAVIRHDCPERLSSVDSEFLRDKYTVGSLGAKVKGKATAFTSAHQLLTEWSDGSIPSEWGEKTFLVIDSLTFLGRAAYNWADVLNPGAKDKRQTFFSAQTALANLISLITSDDFHTNVIVITHIKMVELDNGLVKGLPATIGNRLSEDIGTYFNNVIMAESRGAGKNAKRVIKTLSATVDLKTTALFTIESEYPLASGLASIVKTLKENKS